MLKDGRIHMRNMLATFATLAWLVPAAQAQDATDYPNRPIHIIVAVPAGGGVDTVTRIIAQHLQQKLGQPVVVENRAGAGGNLGAEYVFTAPPDGYTLLASQPSPLTTNPMLYKKMAFDPTQFEPVIIMTSIANVLLVRPDFPAQTAKEFIDYCKAHPGKVNYASQGVGTTSHLTAALFEKVTGTKLVHVPYKGTAPALNDLISSHVDFIFMELPPQSACTKQARRAFWRWRPSSASPNCPTFRRLMRSASKTSSPALGTRSARRRGRPSRSSTSSTGRSTKSSRNPRCGSISPKWCCTPRAAARHRRRPSSPRKRKSGTR